jgi:hypothetical protein
MRLPVALFSSGLIDAKTLLLKLPGVLVNESAR